jgi:hypothetical protein
MSRISVIVLSICCFFIAACAAEDVVRFHGIQRGDALAIREILVKERHAHKIYWYRLSTEGDILVDTDVGSYKARRVRGQWVLTETAIMI